METRWSTEPTSDHPAWELLKRALSRVCLSDEKGIMYELTTADFMLMSVHGDWASFKNIETRNYVRVCVDGSLFIPITNEPFNRGTFERHVPIVEIRRVSENLHKEI